MQGSYSPGSGQACADTEKARKGTTRNAKKGIRLELTNDALTKLAHLGFSEKYGARPLNGIIRNYLRRPISRMIIGGELKKGDLLEISVGKDNELIWNK